MSLHSKLEWYVKRLAAMTPAEIRHRIAEQAKRKVDSGRMFSWDQFGRFDSAIYGLGLRRLVNPAGCEHGRKCAELAEQGRFVLHNQRWPEPDGDWLRTIWHLDPVTGTRWPGEESFAFDVEYRDAASKGDVKFVWEINRLGFLQLLAANAGDNEETWSFIVTVLKAWMGANPPFRGVNWTNGIEAASRLVSFFVILEFADEKRRAGLSSLARPFVAAHAYWIDRYPSLYSSANNHRIAELVAVYLAGVLVPGLPEATRYVRESHAALEDEVARQFFSDGVGAEQSPAYAAYSLEWLMLAGLASESVDRSFSEQFRSRTAAAVRHLSWICDEGGHVPHIGDDDEGRVLQFHGRSYIASVSDMASRWLGIAPQHPVGHRTFREGGYTVIREPLEQGVFLVVFDHGPLGYLSLAAHGHADALSVWLHWGDEPILIDAGTYLYHSGGRDRSWFRGTPAHNTLSINDENQSKITGTFNWSNHARTCLVEERGCVAAAQHDGYVRRFGVTHRRIIRQLDARTYRIEDKIDSRRKREGLVWRTGFLIDPSVTVAIDGHKAYLRTPKGRGLSLCLDAAADRSWETRVVDCSAHFNAKCPTNRIETSGPVPLQGSLTITTLIRADDV